MVKVQGLYLNRFKMIICGKGLARERTTEADGDGKSFRHQKEDP